MFWKDADIFVFPTYYHNECFPLVILEAMEQGLSVISTNEGGIPGIIDNGNSGYTVEKNNPSSLASAIELLIKDTELSISMGKAGRQLFEEKFTEEVFEKRMKKMLGESELISFKQQIIINHNSHDRKRFSINEIRQSIRCF